ncbi:MAG TPA: methyltransferase domain-containing protein [Ktedonobacteraceae bacterium]|nr:methyltransferase domain-containing protein [Ktedonobacteraceae bacterium]
MTRDENSENTYIIDSESGAEMARLIDQDHSMNEAMGSWFPEPIDLTEIHRVLDVACGPGGWAQEVAWRYPHLQVVGIDISQAMIAYAGQRALVQRLDNASFQVMDARAPLSFPDGAFDLVNARFISAFLPRGEWPGVIRDFARLTRPGGSIVLTEVDIFSPDNTNSPALEEWNALCREAVYRAGLYTSTGIRVTSILDQLLQEAGCQDIRQQWHTLDFSAGTPAHATVCLNLEFALKLVQPFLLKMVQTTQARLNELYTQGLHEMNRDDFHGLTTFLTAWGTRSAI